jgi:hypothetical protein
VFLGFPENTNAMQLVLNIELHVLQIVIISLVDFLFMTHVVGAVCPLLLLLQLELVV